MYICKNITYIERLSWGMVKEGSDAMYINIVVVGGGDGECVCYFVYGNGDGHSLAR